MPRVCNIPVQSSVLGCIATASTNASILKTCPERTFILAYQKGSLRGMTDCSSSGTEHKIRSHM